MPRGGITERFWAKVDRRGPDECWPWTGATSRDRGYFSSNGRIGLASRAAYELATGEKPGDLFVCHSCDNPICVNPRHLWLGTHRDNMRDIRLKGRSNGPERALRAAKLNERQVRQILADQRSLATIAADYGVSKVAIHFIKKGKTWVHLSGAQA